jgi:hypothetical protein
MPLTKPVPVRRTPTGGGGLGFVTWGFDFGRKQKKSDPAIRMAAKTTISPWFFQMSAI